MSEYTTAGFGATINGKHTWKDYGLVIGNTDIVSEPSPKTNYIEVPGSSIRIDLTETLTGQVEYESRQLKFSLGKMEREDLWPESILLADPVILKRTSDGSVRLGQTKIYLL